MGKWVTDADSGERYYLPDDKEAEKNVPGYLSDEVNQCRIEVKCDGANEIILDLKKQLIEEKKNKKLKLPILKLMALIVVACIVIMGTAFGVKYISSLDIEQEIVEAPVQQEIQQQQESVQQEPVQDLQEQKETEQVTQVQQEIPKQQSKDLFDDGILNNWLIRLMISAAGIAIAIRRAIKIINMTRGD